MATMKCTALATAFILFSLQSIVAQDGGISFDDITSQFPGIFSILRCFTPCSANFTGNEVIPGTGCIYYHECWQGVARSRKGCGTPLLFNEERDYCDFPSEFICYDGIECPETPMPVDASSVQSTPRPSPPPTMPSTQQDAATPAPNTPQPTPRPTSCTAPTCPCSRKNPCGDGLCCSEWGWCSQCPPVVAGSGFNYDANHGEDSRLIAYVGNWQRCPTDQMSDAWSHIVIAFAVSYTWAENKNLCDEQCKVAPVVPICENEDQQDLVDIWRAQGKKVILSFGGAGMGGNWAGDRNNCWDHCFGREEQLSTDLVGLVNNQNFDGIDIDYEYCYDVGGKQSVGGRCDQVTSLYSDEKAQRFLADLTRSLRIKLDQLQADNGYSRGRYELTHAPMDVDLTPYNGEATAYFEILKARRADLDFIMPQFYNGYFTPKQGLAAASGVWDSGGQTTIDIFALLSNVLFENEPWKVVFGFCLNVCTGQVYAEDAVQIMSELKTIRNGEFACNRGAFFWVADEDENGLWSDVVAKEVSRSVGCSNSLAAQRPTKPSQTDVAANTLPPTPLPAAESENEILPPSTGRPTLAETSQMQQPAPTLPNQTILQPELDAPTAAGGDAMGHIESKRDLIEQFVLISYTTGVPGLANPSRSYTYDNLMRSLQIMAVDGFGAPFKFDLWQGNEDKYHYGLVNLAAFLASAMVETIQYDACDELNWEQTSGRFAISNSCGMEGRSWQDESCGLEDDIYCCKVITEMEITSNSAAAEERAPPPLECKPGTGEGNYAGYWDAISGSLFASAPYSNNAGRTDTEGCCWWGRGALLTRGVCQIGKLNHFLGKGGADLGLATLYPSLNFCDWPQATCADLLTEELRWTVALFDWSERIQRYESDCWVYEEQLKQFVDGGMTDDSFIDSVSRVLTRGCHAAGCSELEARELDRRRSNFYLIVNDIFDVNRILNPPDPTPRPTPPPTTQPSPRPTPWPFQTPPPETATTPPPTSLSSGPDQQTTDYPTIDGDSPLIGLEGNGAAIHTSLKLMAVTTVILLLVQ